jgi:hypothetical protein
MRPNRKLISELRASLPDTVTERLDLAVEKMVEAKRRGQAIVVVTGSGPNVHEGVTTLIAALIHQHVVDGVITSSAVVGHEMAGTLDRVRRVKIEGETEVGFPLRFLPRGRVFEITCLSASQREALQTEIPDGWDLYERLERMPGDVIIKAAGNVAWPLGLRTERLAREAEKLAKELDTTVEHVVGLGADPLTIIGAGVQCGVPVVVSVPQLVGSGAVGLAIGDAVNLTRRCRLVAELLERAEVIVESAVALAQEIHDGPFETYTGHGIWAAWEHLPVFSLEGKVLIRIDLDPALELAWRQERTVSRVQEAVDRGLPKAKLTGLPFRMEMSGFARLEGSIPIRADIGVAWPIIACALEERLGINLDFVSAPQETDAGQTMREWIVEHIQWVDRKKMHAGIERHFEQRDRQPEISPPDSPVPG